MFKNVYIRAAPALGKILSQSIPKALFGQDSCPNYFPLGRNLTQILNFGTECFGTGRGGKSFLAQIPKFGIWDLGFGTDFLCRGGDALKTGKGNSNC
jgi:hypothetical protein